MSDLDRNWLLAFNENEWQKCTVASWLLGAAQQIHVPFKLIVLACAAIAQKSAPELKDEVKLVRKWAIGEVPIDGFEALATELAGESEAVYALVSAVAVHETNPEAAFLDLEASVSHATLVIGPEAVRLFRAVVTWDDMLVARSHWHEHVDLSRRVRDPRQN